MEEEEKRVLIWSCEATRVKNKVARERQPGQRDSPVTRALVTHESMAGLFGAPSLSFCPLSA